MELDPALYKAFYLVARLGNLTQAAAELCITQPALSKKIQLMEHALGCRLFVRQPKGMELTAEGHELYPYARQACEALTAGEKKLQSLLNLTSGEVRIGSSDLLLQHCILPRLVDFCQQHPHIHISTRTAQALHLLDDIRYERIDFALVMQPLPEEAELDFLLRPVCEVEDIFIAAKPFEHLKDRTVPLDEVLAQPIICLDKRTVTRRYQDAFFQQQGLSLAPRMELATTVLIEPLVEKGLGLGLVIENFATEAMAAGRVFKVQTKPIPRRTVCAVTSRHIRLSPAASRFLSLML